MNTGQLLSICLRSIFRSRMRSLLTSLGIIIGVGSVIIMVALGEGSQRVIEEQWSGMGTNLLYVFPQYQMRQRGQNFSMRASSFSVEDIEKLRNESSFAEAITGMVQSSSTVVGSEGDASVQIVGVEPDYEAMNIGVDEGNFFSSEDLFFRNRVAVLGRTTAKNLLGDDFNALGKQIRIGSVYFTVIGLLKSRGVDSGGGDRDDIIIIPLDTAMTRLNNSRNINSIVIKVVSDKYLEAARKETELILRESRNIADEMASGFEIMSQSDMIEMASATSKTLTTLLAAIAGVSLLVGGIGIMNIMLVSVTERTREIGLRMAVGGRKRDILFQFLTESVILSLMGGVLGIALAFLVCRIMSAMGIPTAINPLIVAASALFAALVGVVFGYYPALKAARLYPIDALRYE